MESKGWKTKSWGCACALTSSPRITPTAGNMQIQLRTLKNRHGKLLGGGPMIVNHVTSIQDSMFIFPPYEPRSWQFLRDFQTVLRSIEMHRFPCPVFFLAPSFQPFYGGSSSRTEFLMAHFICPSAWLGSGFSDLDHTTHEHCSLREWRTRTCIAVRGHSQSWDAWSCWGRRPWQHLAWWEKFRKLLCECSWGKKHWRYLIYK